MAYQSSLLPNLTARFPSTRYQGSKAKLADWIWAQISSLTFETCLDAFSGTCSVGYRMKQGGKQVVCNDILRFNHLIAQALVENRHVRLTESETAWLLSRHPTMSYPTFVQDTFQDIYFTNEENRWIDQTVTNIRELSDRCKAAIAYFALFQSCIVKRPFNLFHRKNLYLRFADVKRSFGNKASWDRPFDAWFRDFVNEGNEAVFDNGKENRALNMDAADVPDNCDLVYVDTPYISRQGIATDYRDFYHFLEGLTLYKAWGAHLDASSKHRRLMPLPSDWTNKNQILSAFERLFERFQESILVVSYRSDGIPDEDALVETLSRYKRRVRIEHFGQYKYVLSKNGESKEILLIGE